ncbi:hypothetical protein [Escherichia phage ECP2304]|uniref:Uncharacterized protein n=1 Tax=Cronobacter phage CSP1 TaxID=1983560 RepID=A0AB33CHT5_9CAUD|nr:hypothetical protein [Escherichia phage ECP2304]
MNNFDSVLKQAITEYSKLSGKSEEEIIKECQDFNSQTSVNIRLLMFAAL